MPDTASSETPAGQPVAALTAVRPSLSTITRFEDLDDVNALELRRLSHLWERRLHRPLKVLLIGIPCGCTGLYFGADVDIVRACAVLFVLSMTAGVIVAPLTTGLMREESHHRGVSARVLRQLQRLDVNTRWYGKTDAAFLVDLQKAREREQRHREQPTALSTIRRLLGGP